MMRILALDTAAKTASIALLEEDRTLMEIYVDLGVHHSGVLLPAIDYVCSLSGIRPSDMDLLACTTGPGSFTGLRIGAATVKGLALPCNTPVAGVSTLEALAMNASPSSLLVCSMLDARRKQVYTALYRMGTHSFPDFVKGEQVIEVEAVLADLRQKNEKVLFLGDGAVLNRIMIEDVLGDAAVFPAAMHHRIKASAVGLIGRRMFMRGDTLDFVTFTPNYLRLSEAEAKSRSAGSLVDKNS